MRWRRAAAVCLAVGLLLPSALARTATTRPQTGKSDAWPDAWLADIAMDELKRFAATGELDALARRIEAVILARLACGPADKLDALTDLVYVLRACRYLPQAEKASGGKDLPKYLLDNPAVSRLLLRAIGDVKDPARSLAGMNELVAAEDQAVQAYPELAVAFATSTPWAYRKQPAPLSMLDSFRWYTKTKVAFRYNLKKMPFELSRYLADTRLSAAERQWAVGTYARTGNLAKAYFDLKYDYDHYRKGAPKKISQLPFTLPNLRKVGGVCIEQAYYAGEVCKALGVPAVVVIGKGSSGMGHAWMGALQVARGGRQAVWDCATGRYEAHQYFTGQVREPAGGKRILDSELMLVGAAAQLPLARREQADAATALAGLVQRAIRTGSAGDPDELKKMAELYNRRLAGQGGNKRFDAAAIGSARKIDVAVVEDLLDAAVRSNLAYRPAWEAIIALRKSGQMPVEHLDRFFDLLVTRTAKDYPDYSCVMVLRIVPTVKDAARREAVYRKSLGVYRSRPDLQGRILIAAGDDYKASDQPDKALAAYEQAAVRCADLAEVVLAASARAEAMLIGARRRDLAIKMYAKLYRKAKKRRSAFRSQTAHYQLGKRLADLLIDDGKDAAAQRIRREINN